MGLKEALFANKDNFGPDQPAVGRGKKGRGDSEPDEQGLDLGALFSDEGGEGGLFDSTAEVYSEDEDKRMAEKVKDFMSILDDKGDEEDTFQAPSRFDEDFSSKVMEELKSPDQFTDDRFTQAQEMNLPPNGRFVPQYDEPQPRQEYHQEPQVQERFVQEEKFYAPPETVYQHEQYPHLDQAYSQENVYERPAREEYERMEQPQMQYDQQPQVYEQAKNNLRELEIDYSECERSSIAEDADAELKDVLLILAKTKILEDIAKNYTSQIVTPTALQNAVEAFLNEDSEPYSNYKFVLSAVLDEVISSDYTYQAYDGFVGQILESVKKDLNR